MGPPGAGPEDGPQEGMGPPASLRSRFAEARYFLPLLSPVKWTMLGVVGCSVGAILCRLPFTFIPQQLTLNFGAKTHLFIWLSFSALGLLAAGALMMLRGYYSAKVGEHVLRGIRRRIYNQMEHLNMLSVASRGAGQFVQRLARDVFTIRSLFNETLTELVTESFRGLVLLAVMLWMEPVLTVIVVAVFLTVSPFVRRVNRRVEKLARQSQQQSEQVLEQLVESVGGFRDLVAGGRFRRFAGRFDKLLANTESLGVRTAFWGQIGGVMPALVSSVLLVIPYYVAVGRLENIQDLGRLITYMMLLGQTLPILGQLTRATSELALATPSLRQVRGILEHGDDGPRTAMAMEDISIEEQTPAEPADEAESTTHQFQKPIGIRFEHVAVGFGGRPVLRDISFDVPPGKLTAIVGQSGAGKTTLFHLMLRLIEPNSGRIDLNGVPLGEIRLPELRRVLGFIPQNPFIFNQSLRENLLLAAPDDTSDDDLATAAEIAQLNELVASRRDAGGLDFVAGYMGARLSGGERQRIALGRLILQNPDVVVCDEYTANIDVKTARLIHDALRDYFAGRTRILISHELYTIKGADHIVVLDAGAVADEGTHEELIARPGLYRDLWEIQALA